MRRALRSSSLTRSFLDLGLLAWVPIALLFVSPLAFGGGDVDKGGTDRGDNPVVGSLPCMVDPDMEWMFWEPLGNDPNGGIRPGFPAAIAFVGDDLDDSILDADGDPFGIVNDDDGWDAAGSNHACQFYLDRAAVDAREVTSWHWAPSEYIGGTMVMSSPFGSRIVDLDGNAVCIPIQGLSTRTGGGISIATFKISPSSANPTLPVMTVRVTVNGPSVIVDYIP